MRIYEHRATVVAAGGSTSTVTLNVIGGLCRQLLVRSNTTTTVFRCYLEDSHGLLKRNYGICTGELNDVTFLPMTGYNKLYITNASPNDTFKVYLGVQE